jgi:hypothetical protein
LPQLRTVYTVAYVKSSEQTPTQASNVEPISTPLVSVLVSVQIPVFAPAAVGLAV